jgi:hypothetical protein
MVNLRLILLKKTNGIHLSPIYNSRSCLASWCIIFVLARSPFFFYVSLMACQWPRLPQPVCLYPASFSPLWKTTQRLLYSSLSVLEALSSSCRCTTQSRYQAPFKTEALSCLYSLSMRRLQFANWLQVFHEFLHEVVKKEGGLVHLPH